MAVAAVVTDMEAVVVATLPNTVVVVIFSEADSGAWWSALRFRLARFHLATVLWFSG